MGVITEHMESKYARGRRRPWRLRFAVYGLLGLLIAGCLAIFVVPFVVGTPLYVTESGWSVSKTPDDDAPGVRVGWVYPELEVRPGPSPIPAVTGVEYSERKLVAFAFYGLTPGDTVEVLSVKRRHDPDADWVSAGTDLRLQPEPRHVEGTLRTPYFKLAADQPSVEYVEFELHLQVQLAGQDSVPVKRTVVFRFQKEDRSGLRFSHP